MKVYDVTIAGMALKLKSSHDEETVRNLVQFVDRKINEALPLTKSGSVNAAALLACLNISEELAMLKKKANSEIDQIEFKIQGALSDLESSRASRMGLDH